MFSLLCALKCLLILILLLILLQNGSGAWTTACKNGGNETLVDNKIVCHCPHPFKGLFCEDYACVNGLSTGDQYNPQSVFFNKRCLCDPGWTGELCEISLINRCGENGNEQRGRCICNKEFAGDRCQFVTKCAHGQLYNGRCSCHYGWTGDFCDKIVCHHGEPDEVNEACNCPSKYRGRFCEFCAQPASLPPPECSKISGRQTLPMDTENAPVILSVVIATALFVMGTIVCLIAVQSRRSKKFTNKKRKTVVDVEKLLSQETFPLHGNNQTTDAEVTKLSDKFHDTPPPSYDSVVHHQKNTTKLNKNSDSGFNDSDEKGDPKVNEFDNDAQAAVEDSLRKETAQSSSSKLSVRFVDDSNINSLSLDYEKSGV